LDVFCDFRFGRLEWRGILVRNVHVPHVEYAQTAAVVNYPGFEYPFIRIHETKHASGQRCEGTVLGFEFTNAPTRYYPIETDRNRQLNDRYQRFLLDEVSSAPLYFAGRLANYLYIDMDDCMRQALDAAEQLLQAAAGPRPAGGLARDLVGRDGGRGARPQNHHAQVSDAADVTRDASA
jgi:UDP-galactopyranose mutase